MIDTNAALDRLEALVIRGSDQLVVAINTHMDDNAVDIQQLTRVLKERFGRRVTVIFGRGVDVQLAVVREEYDG